MNRWKKRICAVLIAATILSQAIFGNSLPTSAASGIWKQDSMGWWYYYPNGSYAKSTWLKYGGKWYYLDDKGYMVTGWKRIGGKWYYFDANGKMVTGWKKISGKWYFFKSGVMVTGWQKISNKWYFFSSKNGNMVTGWQKLSGTWYFFATDGYMVKEKTGIHNLKIGDTFIFGKYEQDGYIPNGTEAIEWRVLDKKGEKYFVISEYILDNHPYEDSYDRADWEFSEVRPWLNNTFYSKAFNSTEKKMILTTTVKAEYSEYATGYERDTKDKIFLLSLSEVEGYFYNAKDRKATTTEYADISRYPNWWLRTPGYFGACYINDDGLISTSGNYCMNNMGIRPAMWIKP